MSNFKTPLVVSPLPDSKHWKLHTKFVYSRLIRVCSDGTTIIPLTVPAGFVTDFASVPWPFWSFIRPWGKWGKAAVLHDFMYQTKEWGNGSDFGDWARYVADNVFLEAMKELGVAPWRRRLMYWGVRAFGFLAWRKGQLR